ncbi:chlorophyll A-B binding protein [Nitzschia inconspicua]|uniref:Chlorophyll A-B binding protein n=1 Tax=Nitzschia inconspicua TaxID=303405 RepID=A0A9K3KFX5_9STRA|nr:chlorophyll A-B binding protein [Nitzschia inconspicua]KAG7342772.1 chlorophyll A-B binding protein [Nitzschia inconspicua]
MTKLLIPLALVCSGASAFVSRDNVVSRSSTGLGETKADLEDMAAKLNRLVKYWDPLDLVDASFWGFSREQTIGWLRQSEVKHGRVAMAAFVGYCVQSNFVFPWSLTSGGMPHPSTDLSPPEQWDALPFASKVQIILFIGFLEFYSELYGLGEPHYTKGGKVGKYPEFKGTIPHPVPFNLYDPFGLSKNKSEESKARGLLSEINNGRLAMLGIFGFLCEQTIPGSVPLLTGIVKPYAGEVMAPFSADFTL